MDVLEELLTVDAEMAMDDLQQYRDHFARFNKRMPSELLDQLTSLANRLHYAVTKVRACVRVWIDPALLCVVVIGCPVCCC